MNTSLEQVEHLIGLDPVEERLIGRTFLQHTVKTYELTVKHFKTCAGPDGVVTRWVKIGPFWGDWQRYSFRWSFTRNLLSGDPETMALLKEWARWDGATVGFKGMPEL